MLEKLLNTFCNSIIAQFKLPRKGVMMILFLLSSIAIAVNKCIFHYSIAPKGSLLLQLFYGLWIYSVMTIPVRAYNEYCDKKDAAKKENEAKQKAKEKLDEYFEMFDYCSSDEKEILAKFYAAQQTSCPASGSEISSVKSMTQKSINILSYNGYESSGGTIITSSSGLKIITKYFDREKPEFFELLNSLEQEEIKLLKDFVNLDDEQITLYKKEIKIAKAIINKFENTKFDDIYIDAEGYFTIPTLYLAYLRQYFLEEPVKIES